MFKNRRAAQWKRLEDEYGKYEVSNLKDGRIEALVIDARMDWDRGREARAIRKMRKVIDLLQQNIVLRSEYDHIQDSISDTRGNDKVKKLDEKLKMQMVEGRIGQARRTVRRLTRNHAVSSNVNTVTLETRLEEGYGVTALIQNCMDKPITIREIKTRSSDGNEDSLFVGLSTIDSRSSEFYHLSTGASPVREIFVYYSIDTKTYTIARRFRS